ncbi:MAG TPA: GAF and ANTAR domain-containing protein [Jatrophihabitans sp.]|jgi:transcriptional regulator with GAF, ATPase, and Fis domain|nr:GAF and ANTAR domain-containing protein [Jatrophihabitans sp.]
MTQPNADLFARLARQLATEEDRDAILRRLVAASVSQIDGAEHAGITVLTRKAVATPIATDDLVRDVDKHQYTTGEGPCLTAAIEHQHVVRVDDLHTDLRWPEFSTAIADLGVRSMLSFQLYTGEDTIGALNIYAAVPNAFTEDSIHTGALLATHAALAAAAAEKSSNLRIALQSRDTIGQAKGILMERYKLTAEQAFDLLITASQHTHLKLRDIAEQLTATGELTTD